MILGKKPGRGRFSYFTCIHFSRKLYRRPLRGRRGRLSLFFYIMQRSSTCGFTALGMGDVFTARSIANDTQVRARDIPVANHFGFFSPSIERRTVSWAGRISSSLPLLLLGHEVFFWECRYWLLVYELRRFTSFNPFEILHFGFCHFPGRLDIQLEIGLRSSKTS